MWRLQQRANTTCLLDGYVKCCQKQKVHVFCPVRSPRCSAEDRHSDRLRGVLDLPGFTCLST